jgi:hypothetical protein
MTKTKRTILVVSIILLVLVCILAFVGIRNTKFRNKMAAYYTDEDLDKLESKGSYVYTVSEWVYNSDDLRSVIGYMDYVFVGTVTEMNETRYDEGAKTVDGEPLGDPHTHYMVQVTENIKGNLRTDEPIEIVRNGGVTKDGKSIVEFEGSRLPRVGKVYVFCAFDKSDGRIGISGPYCNTLIGEVQEDTGNVVISDEGYAKIEEYKEAYENEIPYDSPWG